jgi:hypothetical protein
MYNIFEIIGVIVVVLAAVLSWASLKLSTGVGGGRGLIVTQRKYEGE